MYNGLNRDLVLIIIIVPLQRLVSENTDGRLKKTRKKDLKKQEEKVLYRTAHSCGHMMIVHLYCIVEGSGSKAGRNEGERSWTAIQLLHRASH